MLSKEKIISFYSLYSKELLKYLYKLTGDSSVSEDLLHDAFENIIEYSVKKEIDDLTVRAFLYRTAHNVAINYLRKKSRKDLIRIDESMDFASPDDDMANLVSRISGDELNKRIYEILDSLDPVDKSIFVMHKELGKTYDEIGMDLKISARTVRRRSKKILDTVVEIAEKEGFF
jgi:RNA polymerase sigma-70 factor (ECF subfamily)